MLFWQFYPRYLSTYSQRLAVAKVLRAVPKPTTEGPFARTLIAYNVHRCTRKREDYWSDLDSGLETVNLTYFLSGITVSFPSPTRW